MTESSKSPSFSTLHPPLPPALPSPSVENPHVQRFKYTGLITTEFLQRSKAARFPSIEGELAVLAAHCGSLQLDPWALDDVARELVLLETVQQASNFGPLAQVEGLVEGRWDRGVAGMRF